MFEINFTGCITIKAKNRNEAQEIFWNWVGNIQDRTHYDNYGIILETPTFECNGVEEE